MTDHMMPTDDLLAAAARMDPLTQQQLADELAGQARRAAIGRIAAAIRDVVPDAMQATVEQPVEIVAGDVFPGVHSVIDGHGRLVALSVLERINAPIDRQLIVLAMQAISDVDHDGGKLVITDTGATLTPRPVYAD